MKKLLALTLFLLTGLLVGAVLATVPTTLATAASAEEPGKQIFLAEKCNMCHAIASQGIEAKTKSEKMKGPDLGGCCADADPAQLAKYIKKEAELDGKKHKGSFKGSDEELQALIDWLLEQKAE